MSGYGTDIQMNETDIILLIIVLFSILIYFVFELREGCQLKCSKCGSKILKKVYYNQFKCLECGFEWNI